MLGVKWLASEDVVSGARGRVRTFVAIAASLGGVLLVLGLAWPWTRSKALDFGQFFLSLDLIGAILVACGGLAGFLRLTAFENLGISDSGLAFRFHDRDVELSWSSVPEPKAFLFEVARGVRIPMLEFLIRDGKGSRGRKVRLLDAIMVKALIYDPRCPVWVLPLWWWSRIKLNPPPGWPVK